MKLPKQLRDAIWNAYKPGQEISMRPSRAYLDAADAVQKWIAEHHPATASARPPADDPKDEAGDFSRPTPPRRPDRTHPTPSPKRHKVTPAYASTTYQLAIHFAKRKQDVIELQEVAAEEWTERSAIREYSGGIPRPQAERAAVSDTIEYFNTRFATQ